MSFQNPVFIPGPTNMPEAIRKACDMPTIDHRSPLFGQILHPARANVQQVLKSETAEIFIFPSTGTGGWETALSNTLNAGDRVLAARNGMVSHRWIDMCQRHKLDVQIVETPWGQGLPAGRYEEILKADTRHQIKVVLATHNETATGVKSDIAAVRKARSDIPAITHFDYSARVQTVNGETHPEYHALLEEFERQTGCAVLVNTSFNVRGEPIVCSPQEAYRCFMSTARDLPVLED